MSFSAIGNLAPKFSSLGIMGPGYDGISRSSVAEWEGVDQADLVKATLSDEIESKLKEVDSWPKLSEEQKNLVIGSARPLGRRTIIGTVGVILGHRVCAG
jgi:hypothetical protein